MKYIIIDSLIPVIFSVALTHAEVAGIKKVTSAGFVEISMGTDVDSNEIPMASCSGESVSLGIRSDKEHDQKVINRMLNPYL